MALSTTTVTYHAGDELPGLNLPWQVETAQGTWEDLDLSVGYTFTATLTALAGGLVTTPAAVVVGHDGGVTVDWAVGDLELEPGNYVLRVVARETATSKDRTWNPNAPLVVRIIT